MFVFLFHLTQVSERFVKKFGATSCMFRATMQELTTENMAGTFLVKDIMKELSTLFTNAIEQVNILSYFLCTFTFHVEFILFNI